MQVRMFPINRKNITISIIFVALIAELIYGCLTLFGKKSEQLPPSQHKVYYEKHYDEFPHNLTEAPIKFKHYHLNYAHYLKKQQVNNVLEINCDEKCQKMYKNRQYYTQLSPNFKFRESDKYDWINIRIKQNQLTSVNNIVRKYVLNANKGVTIFFQNMNQYKNYSQYESRLPSLMKKHELIFDEIIGLNLRRTEGKIMLIYCKKIIKNSREYSFGRPQKNFMAIQLVLKLNENLPYLREWLGYHIHLGFDKFFIYDNSLAGEGKDWAAISKWNKTHNRYGFDLRCMNYSQQKIAAQLNDIWDQFYEHIVFVPWQPLGPDGQIQYQQMQSIAHYFGHFQDVTKFTAFIDTDQFFFSANKLSLTQYVKERSISNHSSFRFMQIKFNARICQPYKRQLQISKTVPMRTIGWAEKLIIENAKFKKVLTIHAIYTSSGRQYIIMDVNDWGFHHYNTIQSQVAKAQSQLGNTNLSVTQDNSVMMRYYEIIDEVCQGKCSQNFATTCDPNNDKFKCLTANKQFPDDFYKYN